MKQWQVPTIVLLLSAPFLGALEWEAVDVDFSAVWQRNAQIGSLPAGRQPDGFLFTVGASVLADWDGGRGGLYIRPGGWFSWTNQEVYSGFARLTDEATRAHMKVLGLMMNMPFGYAFTAGKVDIGLQGGPSFYLRFPLTTAQNGTANPDDFWRAYYGKAQFLYLALESWAAIPTSDSRAFLAGLRIHVPISNIWTGVNFFHNLQVGIFGSLRFGI